MTRSAETLAASGRQQKKRSDAVAWEDRTRAEKRRALRAAAAYRARDDDKTYTVTLPKGTQLIVKGINSAKVVAGKDGVYEEKK